MKYFKFVLVLSCNRINLTAKAGAVRSTFAISGCGLVQHKSLIRLFPSKFESGCLKYGLI